MVPFYRQYKFWAGILAGLIGFGQSYWQWSTDTTAQVAAFGAMILGTLTGCHALLSDQVTTAPSATPAAQPNVKPEGGAK